MALDPWEKEQIKAMEAEDRRRRACDRKATRAAIALLKAIDEEGVVTDVRNNALHRLRCAADELGFTARPAKHPRKAISRNVTRQVWDRDGWTCQRCGGHTNLTIDHITPISRGGTNDFDNLQTLCGSCNSGKGASV